MKSILIGVAITLLILSMSVTSHGAKTTEYWIDAGREVLVFIGDPGTTETTTVKFKIGQKQIIRLMHKKSGYGLYAFHLRGLVIQDEYGEKKVIDSDGFFIAKKSWLRSTAWKKKTSLKHKTLNK
jgi:hypothetical protein